MASRAESKGKSGGPLLLSVKKIDEDERVKIAFRTVRGRSAKAIFAANDDVETVLDRWNESGRLDQPGREILNDHSLEGWAAGPRTGQVEKKKAREVKNRLKEYQPPEMSPKEARLAKEARILAEHKDEYRGYWIVIGLVTVATLSLLGFLSSF